MVVLPLLMTALSPLYADDIQVAVIGMGTGASAEEVACQLSDLSGVSLEPTVISDLSGPTTT